MLQFIFEKEIKQISSGSINHNNLVTVSDFLEFFFFLLQVKHTQKRKKKLHKINKVIKTKKQKKQKQIANLHTYMAIYLQILKYVTAVLIPYITVLSMIYN